MLVMNFLCLSMKSELRDCDMNQARENKPSKSGHWTEGKERDRGSGLDCSAFSFLPAMHILCLMHILVLFLGSLIRQLWFLSATGI